MSSSDSEAFESADEDVIETKTTTMKKVEKQLNVDNVKESKKNCVKPTEPEPRRKSSELVQNTVIRTTVDDQRLDEEKMNQVKAPERPEPIVDESETENVASKPTSHVKESIAGTQIERNESKQSLSSSCELVEMDSATKPITPEIKGEDDWDFEKWDDDVDNEIDDLVAKPMNSEDKKKLPTKTDEESTEKLSDEDGWQIDDWDDVVPNDEPIKVEKPSNKGDLSNVLDKLSTPKPTEPANNWGWTPWGGMVQLLSTATSHVSQVIESGIGVPNPEEIARLQHEENLKNRDQTAVSDTRRDDKSMSLGNLMSGVSQIGNRVISGGLDTLEGIGKKTMTILQENDPGLLNKRMMLGIMDKDAPVLSQILREAKEKTEEAELNLKEIRKQRYKKQLHFETLFDDYHGLVHLEALEMLSQQSAHKLKALMAALSGLALSELEETLNEVKELCELPEMDNEDSDGLHATEELSDKFKTSVEDLDVTVDFKDIIQCWSENTSWLDSDTTKSSQEIYEKALRCLAQTSAICINKMHKLAELLLIKEHHSTADEADSLVQITSIMCWHLSGVSARFGNSLSQMENKDDVNSLITSIFMEGSNSTSYVQNAFQLFIPILQMGAA